jgi:hypothetical protein
MHLLEVPKVDVIPDGFDWANVIVGGLGFFVGVAAIVIALAAQHTANIGVADERRRLFELEILRDLTKDLDEGLSDRVFTHPDVLMVYRLRLDLLSTRLDSWDQIIALNGVAALMTALGYPDFEMVDKRLVRLSNDLGWLPAAIQTLPVLRHQGEQAKRNILDRLATFDDDLPAIKEGPNGWQDSAVKLSQILARLEVVAADLTEKRTRWLADGKAELRRRMAWDVSQAALSRVEARSHRKWWRFGF